MNFFVKFFSTGCFSGYVPIAPGTFGTAVGVLFFWFIKDLPPIAYIAMLIAFIFFAIWVSGRAQAIFGETDPQKVVIDEIAGFFVTMAFHRPDLTTIIAAFVLFRIFDITKLWPIGWIERRYPDGRGIVLDDVLAGVYANAALWLIELLIPHFRNG